MSLSANLQKAILPVKTRLGDGGEFQIPALSENERAMRIVQAYRPLGTVAQAGPTWPGRSHRVPTTGRLRRMSCRDDSWAMRGSHNTCVFKWPSPVWPVGVCTKRARGMLEQLKVAWPWRIIAGAHRPPPPSQRWKSNDAVQRELEVGNLEDELAGMRLRYVARAAMLAPPYVLVMLQSVTWRSAVLDDMECMHRLLAPKLDELSSSRDAVAVGGFHETMAGAVAVDGDALCREAD